MKIKENFALSGWGNFKTKNCKLVIFDSFKELHYLIGKKDIIARGEGKSYYDQSYSKQEVISTVKLNKILSFDKETGLLECESGITLEKIIKTFLPSGWFPYVVPGTKKLTIGGMIAANIHGKNHHKVGGMVNFVEAITLYDGQNLLKCSRKDKSDLFFSTFGGMGLTGLIVSCKIRLNNIKTTKITSKNIPTNGIHDMLKKLRENSENEFIVGWMDLVNKDLRGIIFCGDLSKEKIEPNYEVRFFSIKLPMRFLSIFFTRTSVRLFNKLFFLSKTLRKSTFQSSLDDFFFPLDSLTNWNQIYGDKGFSQFQCVVPYEKSEEMLKKTHEIIKKFKGLPGLVVIKYLKDESEYLSFPIDGLTISVDIKEFNKSDQIFKELHSLVIGFDGRVYLTKDSKLKKEEFISMYKNNALAFKKVRNKYSLNNFSSYMSTRIGLSK